MQKHKLLECAKILRKTSTIAEQVLWQCLRNRKFMGVKIRRQYWIDRYIADFACLERKLIIELDGDSHINQREHDISRTDVLSVLNFKVVRFWNWEVLNNLPKVLENIAKNI